MNRGARRILSKIAQGFAVIFVVYTLTFILVSILPGDAIEERLSSPELGYTPEEIDEFRSYYGLNDPLPVQYFRSLGRLLTGDLGRSLADSLPVADKISAAFPETALLAVAALVVGIVLAVLISLLTVFGKLPFLATIGRSLPSFLQAVPTFIVCIVLIQVFSFQLGWFPAIGSGSIQTLVLPAVALGIFVAAPVAQVLITSLKETADQPFVKFARARGFGTTRIFARQLLRVSSLPAITAIGNAVTWLLAGAIVTEAIFARSGLGRVLEGAVQKYDLPVIQGTVIFVAAIFVIVNLAIEGVYLLIDPRLRVSRAVGAAA
jgi:peptide/nickel transport system permease protein